jgi:NADPH-dependent ferric siderophore reductase
MRRVRDVLVDEKALPKEAMRVSAYWKQGAADFHEDIS